MKRHDRVKSAAFTAGERVTYLELFHATVLKDTPHGVIITYIGKGLLSGEHLHKRVPARTLQKGWNELAEFVLK